MNEENYLNRGNLDADKNSWQTPNFFTQLSGATIRKKINYQPLFKYRKPVRTPPACDASEARSDPCGILGSLTEQSGRGE